VEATGVGSVKPKSRRAVKQLSRLTLSHQAEEPSSHTVKPSSRRLPTIKPSSRWAVVPPTVKPSNHRAAKLVSQRVVNWRAVEPKSRRAVKPLSSQADKPSSHQTVEPPS
jgi:hypothetical protein